MPMLKQTVLCAALLCAATARAAPPGCPMRDHLVPEGSVFAMGDDSYLKWGYDKAFAPFLQTDVMVRMIAAPAFSDRYAVGLRETSGGYTVFGLSLGRAGKPSVHCEAAIAKPLGQSLVAAWRVVLLGTRFSDDVAMGLDGIEVHFSMRENFEQPPGQMQTQFLYGQVWTPNRGSPPDRLLGLADDLQNYCVTHDRAGLPGIAKAAVALARSH